MSSAHFVETLLTCEDNLDDWADNDVSTSFDTDICGDNDARDEIKEIQNISRTETRLIRTWRFILLALLVITATAVSSVTYVLLQQQEKATFQASVRTLVAMSENPSYHGS
jgi:hypothetical protein